MSGRTSTTHPRSGANPPKGPIAKSSPDISSGRVLRPHRGSRPRPALLQPGDRFDRFHLEAVLGHGGFGAVYRIGEQGKPYALKIVHNRFADTEEQRERLMDEGRLLVMLKHPNVVEVHETGIYQGQPWLRMELLEGFTLRQISEQRGKMTLPLVVSYMIDAGFGANVGHQFGAVHRDIKPENLFVVRTPTSLDREIVKLLDFGIAKHYGSPDTAPGQSSGTPLYMAPEQIRNLKVTPATDVYALGSVFYETYAGRHPFVENLFAYDMFHLFHQHLNELPVPLTAIGMPKPIWDVLARAMAKHPQARFPDGLAFSKALLVAGRLVQEQEPWLWQTDPGEPSLDGEWPEGQRSIGFQTQDSETLLEQRDRRMHPVAAKKGPRRQLAFETTGPAPVQQPVVRGGTLRLVEQETRFEQREEATTHHSRAPEGLEQQETSNEQPGTEERGKDDIREREGADAKPLILTGPLPEGFVLGQALVLGGEQQEAAQGGLTVPSADERVLGQPYASKWVDPPSAVSSPPTGAVAAADELSNATHDAAPHRESFAWRFRFPLIVSGQVALLGCAFAAGLWVGRTPSGPQALQASTAQDAPIAVPVVVVAPPAEVATALPTATPSAVSAPDPSLQATASVPVKLVARPQPKPAAKPTASARPKPTASATAPRATVSSSAKGPPPRPF